MLTSEIAACCKTLKLSHHMVENSAQITAESHQAYLLKLLQLEIEQREAARKDRLLRNANFYTLKTFNDYCFDEIKLPQGLTPEAIKACNFIAEKRNLILYGNVGAGNYRKNLLMERN